MKGNNPIILQHDCDIKLDLHRQNTPDDKIFKCNFGGKGGTPLFDLTLILSVFIILCSVCSLCKSIKKFLK